MFLVFGQFWNQTRSTWDWQQIGGAAISETDAKQYAEGFAKTYGVPSKVVGKDGTTIYLPPVADEGQALEWPKIHANMVGTAVPRPPYLS